MESTRNGYVISDDPARIDLDLTWGFLRAAYWSPNVPREVVARSISNSLVFGVYGSGGSQVGFARAVTDRAAFAWIADLFILEAHRGRGLGKWLVETVLAHPDLQRLRVIMLATADAHELYRRYGFEVVRSDHFLELRRSPADLYGDAGGG